MQVKGYGDATTGNLKTNNTQTAALTATFCQSKIPWQMFVTITHLPHPHIWSIQQNVNSSCLDWLIEFTVACLLTCRGKLQWAATGEIQVEFEPPGLIDTAPLTWRTLSAPTKTSTGFFNTSPFCRMTAKSMWSFSIGSGLWLQILIRTLQIVFIWINVLIIRKA